MIISAEPPSQGLSAPRRGSSRGSKQLPPYSSFSQNLCPSLPHSRVVFCSCGQRPELGTLGRCWRKVGSKGRAPDQRNRPKQETCIKRQTNHPFGHSTQHCSDHTSKQRTRTDCSHESGSPRSITSGSEYRIKSGIPHQDGDRDAGHSYKESLQNRYWVDIGGKSFIQSFPRVSETSSACLLRLHYTLDKRILPDHLQERGRGNSNQETRLCGMEGAQPLFLQIFA